MRSPFHSRRGDGFTYAELLVGLVIVALVFPPAYRFACDVLDRRNRMPPAVEDAELALEIVSRDIRCAMDSPQGPFHANGETLSFTRASPAGSALVEYRIDSEAGSVLRRNGARLGDQMDGWSFRFFDGESWTTIWGWDAEKRRPTEGMRGLPLAVEISAHDREQTLRCAVPVMAAVLERWTS